MSLLQRLETAPQAIAEGLRPEPTDPHFQERLTQLYRSCFIFNVLDGVGDSDRIKEVKQRFLIYWTYEALDALSNEDADDWQCYMDQCLDYPGFLDFDNVEIMIEYLRLIAVAHKE